MTDRHALLAQLRGFKFQPARERPRLLFAATEVTGIRERALALPEKRAALLAAAREHMKTPGATVDHLQTYISSGVAVEVAQAHLLEPTPASAAWLKARVFALLAAKTWFAPVHAGANMLCDHCMCNTAAHLALVLDLAPDAFAAAEVAEIATGVKHLFLDPFMTSTGNDPCVWWYRPDMASNWKIMCCGEGGLAMCGFAEHWPEAPEALARAAKGVLEVLDMVPREGDWGEGVGYWFHTLWMGLRFARALRRLSDGAIDLFLHPALQTTGDFLTQLTTPSGRVYNFADCDPGLSPIMTETLAMLAAEAKRADWMHVARLAPAASPLYLAAADPALPAAPSTRRTACFPTTGVASLRTGWNPADVFAGLRCGPSTVGHSHLDANSFLLEAGGQPLVPENPYWPQAHFLGFFDSSKQRWNFDGPGTVGHSTLLVDGRGQTYGAAYPGRLLGVTEGAGWVMASGDASACYPGLLRRFVRSLLLAGSDTIIIRDVVECEGERQVEWLLHYAGSIRSEGALSVIENHGVRLTVVHLLPDRANGWRWNDVTRTSVYECSDTRQEVVRRVRYRSFMPFRSAERSEFLFVLRVGLQSDARELAFSGAAGAWTLALPHAGLTVTPAGDTLAATPLR